MRLSCVIRARLRPFAWLALTLTAPPALLLGQTAPDDDQEVVELQEYTVTGSYITRFEQATALPVTTITNDQFQTDGVITPGEIFNDLVFTGEAEFNEAQDGPNDARGDVTSINLRGVGSGQTLALLNGRRLAPHPLNQTISAVPSVLVNANIFPAGLIDRIDILRDGASAIYGTDASAGVVNTILQRNLEGQRARIRYGVTEAGEADLLFDYRRGINLNDGATNISLYVSYYDRDPIKSIDRWYARTGDKRPLVAEKWRGDTSIQNVSSSSIYPNIETRLPSSRDELSIGGEAITNSTGRFHVQPADFSGTRAVLATGFGIDDGTLPRSERYSFAEFLYLRSEAERINFFTTVNHRISDRTRLLGEFGYYRSDTYLERAPTNIGTSADIVIPASNYWNPFGAAVFADGTPNPNRLDGVVMENGDPLPEEGIDLDLRNWRAEDFGPRVVDVENESVLFGGMLDGIVFDEWRWVAGFRYNRNEATDTEGGRFSKSGLTQALDNSTPQALNVFAGLGANDPADFDYALISSTRTAVTSLLTTDARFNNPEVYEIFGNPVGVAFGFEWRQEDYEDDRDPRLDGTIRFDDTFTGESDVVGVSPTPDTASNRDVSGIYGEVLLPLVGEANRAPGLHRLEFQLAGRWEHYSDFGSVEKPKLAVAYYPYPDLLIRGSFAQGFSAPNLSVLTEPIIRFNNGIEDEYRVQYDPNNPDNDGTIDLVERRGGNFGLGPEESETWVVGAVWRVPGVDGLTLNVDYWSIDIEDRIGTQEVDNLLDEDAAILNAMGFDPSIQPGDVVQGSPFVVRGPVTETDIARAEAAGFMPAGPIELVLNSYRNQAGRKATGWDFGYEWILPDTTFGTFTLTGNAAYLETFEDQEDLNDEPFSLIQDEGRPRWRYRTTFSWREGPWRASFSARYISEVIDNDVDADDGEEWVIDEQWTFNVRGEYRFAEGTLEGTRLVLGVRNIFDEDPPLNPDETRGYETALHDERGRYYYAEIRYDF